MKIIKAVSLWFLIGAIVILPRASGQVGSARPNVVVILADDLGWGDVSCQGATRLRTPHIDSLAWGGMRMVNGYAPASVCTPTRYSLLTGRYSWRVDANGLNKGVASGDSPLLVPTDGSALPAMLAAAGYRTGFVGKWHLGFGTSAPDYNHALKPGPLETGFHEYFGLPSTNDRVPTVFIRNHNVVNLEPSDPIRYTYDKNTAAEQGLTTYAAGRNRIGWMRGGRSAWWKDEEIADTLAAEAALFIEQNRSRPFFLLYAPHNIHAPAITHPRFKGSSGSSARADMILELDQCVGEILKSLDKHALSENTLIIFSSDNGAYVTNEDGHRPNGRWRGKKSQSWEGGLRVPFLVNWPGRVKAGHVSNALVSLVDLPATIAAATGARIPAGAAPDSRSFLPVLMGETDTGRESLVLMNGSGDLCLRKGAWKYIPELAGAHGWDSWEKGAVQLKGPGLYHLGDDPGETTNLFDQKPESAQRLATMLQEIKAR